MRLVSLRLDITSPASGQNFDFLSAIAFFASADGQPERSLATSDPVPPGVRGFGCKTSRLELAPYVAAPSMDVTTTSTGKRPTHETTIRATLVLDVDVNVSGLLD